jgi:hypothetical protein
LATPNVVHDDWADWAVVDDPATVEAAVVADAPSVVDADPAVVDWPPVVGALEFGDDAGCELLHAATRGRSASRRRREVSRNVTGPSP